LRRCHWGYAGTLIAAIAFFRIEVWRLIVSFIAAVRKRAIETDEERLAVAIAIGTIPAVIAGGLASNVIDDHLGEPWMIAIQLILFGALLDWADRKPQHRPLERSQPPVSSDSTATAPPASPSCC
jgi:undecaprenyl-diphosphatase